MKPEIYIDVTESKEAVVGKERFRIVKYDFVPNNPFEDLVHNGEPFVHLQILRPKDEEQRKKALEYFKEHGKAYVAFTDRKDILLYVGCTEQVYIKSKSIEVDGKVVRNLMYEAANWFKFYGGEG